MVRTFLDCLLVSYKRSGVAKPPGQILDMIVMRALPHLWEEK
jgi:hypothetical protein